MGVCRTKPLLMIAYSSVGKVKKYGPTDVFRESRHFHAERSAFGLGPT